MQAKKKCPICGGTEVVITESYEHYADLFATKAMCAKCKENGPAGGTWGLARYEAANALKEYEQRIDTFPIPCECGEKAITFNQCRKTKHTPDPASIVSCPDSESCNSKKCYRKIEIKRSESKLSTDDRLIAAVALWNKELKRNAS